MNFISLNFPGRIRKDQIPDPHIGLTFCSVYMHILGRYSRNTFYFWSAPFLIECARQMMRTKSLSVTKMAAPMELFWEWKKISTTRRISIFYLFVSQQIYIFSKSADVCFEISYVSIDNSHVIKMGVFKAIVLLSLKPVFLFDRVNCVAIFQTQSLDNVYYSEIQCSWKSNKGRVHYNCTNTFKLIDKSNCNSLFITLCHPTKVKISTLWYKN